MKKLLFILLITSGLTVFGVFFIKQRPSDVTVATIVNGRDDWCKQIPGLLSYLDKKLKINFHPTGACQLSLLPKNIRRNMKKADAKSQVFFLIDWQQDEIPEIVEQMHFSLKIIYTRCCSSEVSEERIAEINRLFDMVVVPTEAMAQIFQKSGMQKPIFTLPYPTNLEPTLQSPLKVRKQSNLVFANFNDIEDINDQFTLVRAFAQSFGNKECAYLWLHTTYANSFEEHKVLAEIDRLHLKNVYYSKGEPPKESYLKMLNKVDCYLDINKGNGYNLKTLEFMALGTPIIIADHPLNAPFTKHIFHCVATNPTVHFDERLRPNGQYWQAATDQVAAAMLNVFYNYEETLEHASTYREFAKQFSKEQITKKYLTMLKPKKVMLGEINKISEELLVTNSKELLEKYNKCFKIKSQ